MAAISICSDFGAQKNKFWHCTQYASKFGKLSSTTGLEKVSFHSNPKERQSQRMLKLPHNSLGQNTRVGSLFLLQGIFPTQGSNPSLLHCRQILYHLNHKGSPRILEWVAYPFSSRSSWPRNQTGVSCIAGGFCTNWVIREAQLKSFIAEGIPNVSTEFNCQ